MCLSSLHVRLVTNWCARIKVHPKPNGKQQKHFFPLRDGHYSQIVYFLHRTVMFILGNTCIFKALEDLLVEPWKCFLWFAYWICVTFPKWDGFFWGFFVICFKYICFGTHIHVGNTYICSLLLIQYVKVVFWFSVLIVFTAEFIWHTYQGVKTVHDQHFVKHSCVILR